MTLSSKAYTFIKWFCLLFLPALALFIGEVGADIGITNVPTVVKIINAVAVFLGAITKISNDNYYKDKDDGEEDAVTGDGDDD